MNRKLMSLVISGLLVGGLMIGCSSSNTNNKTESSIKEEKYTTQYLTDQGKQAIKNSKEYDYKVITEWTPLMSDYIDNKVKVSGTVEKLHLDNTMAKFLLKLGCGRNFIYLPGNKEDKTCSNCNHETEYFLRVVWDKAT